MRTRTRSERAGVGVSDHIRSVVDDEHVVAGNTAGDLVLPVGVRRVGQIESRDAGAYRMTENTRDRWQIGCRSGSDERRHPVSVSQVPHARRR